MDLNKDEKNILITHAYANFIKNNEELELSRIRKTLKYRGTDLVNAEVFFLDLHIQPLDIYTSPKRLEIIK